MAPTTFPLSLVVDVSVQISPIAAAPPTFNQGLIVGTSSVISSATRVQQFTSLTAIENAGFSTSSPEYLAAQLYFSASPAPQFVWLGRQNLTAIATAIPHSGSAGTGYVVGDIVGVTQAGANGGQLQVLTVGSNGVPETLGVVSGNQGNGYSVATDLVTTGGTGTGLAVDITAIGETPLQAVTACRIASPAWYSVGVCGAADADHLAIAAYAQAATPQMVYFGNTATAAVAAGTAGNIALELQSASYNRVFLQYATTQSGLYPTQAYIFAALMGCAMGLNTGLAGSYFTFKFKTLPGAQPEPITQTQLTTIEGQNANLYLSYAGVYNWEEQGVVSNGQFFDEVLFLDMLASQIQYNAIAVFVSQPSIPQSDAGEQLLISAVQQACLTLRNIGFIAQNGTWTGVTVLNLASGQPLPNGFLVQAPSFSTQAPSDRQARKMMPIYVSFIESGSGHSLTVGVYVQR